MRLGVSDADGVNAVRRNLSKVPNPNPSQCSPQKSQQGSDTMHLSKVHL